MTKHCNFCDLDLPLTEFTKRGSGLRSRCRSCSADYAAEYRKTDVSKAARERWRKSPAGKVYAAKYAADYRKSEVGIASNRASQSRWNKSDAGRAASKAKKAKYPERTRARSAVHHAVQSGKLPRVNSLKCADCPSQAEEYDHSAAIQPYAKHNYLNVTPRCAKCHTKRHRLEAKDCQNG